MLSRPEDADNLDRHHYRIKTVRRIRPMRMRFDPCACHCPGTLLLVARPASVQMQAQASLGSPQRRGRLQVARARRLPADRKRRDGQVVVKTRREALTSLSCTTASTRGASCSLAHRCALRLGYPCPLLNALSATGRRDRRTTAYLQTPPAFPWPCECCRGVNRGQKTRRAFPRRRGIVRYAVSQWFSRTGKRPVSRIAAGPRTAHI